MQQPGEASSGTPMHLVQPQAGVVRSRIEQRRCGGLLAGCSAGRPQVSAQHDAAHCVWLTCCRGSCCRGAGLGAEVKRRILMGTYALSAGYYDAYYKRAQQVHTAGTLFPRTS